MYKRKFTVADMAAMAEPISGVYKYPRDTDYTEIKEFPRQSVFGEGCVFGNDTRFRSWCSFGRFCRFGDTTVFEHECRFEKLARFGALPSFNRYADLGPDTVLNKPFIMEGVIFHRLITMYGLDGSGRKIRLLFGAEAKDDRVIAGCFMGTLDEFTLKAKKENKLVYAGVVPQVFASTRKVWKL